MRFFTFDVFRAGKNFVLFFFGLAFSLSVSAQTPMDKMRADQLVKEADFLLNGGDADAAIPYLDAYLERMKDVNDARVSTMKQNIRFKLTRIFLKEKRYDRGLGYVQDYVANRPAPEWHEAMKLLTVGLLEDRQFEACVSAATNALAGPPADVREALEKAAKAVAAEKDPNAYEFDEFGELIVKEDSAVEAVVETHPSGYSVEDLVLLNMTLGQAYTELGRVEESLEPFSYVVKYMEDPVRKGFAIMQVVNGLVEKKDFDALTSWIPELYRTDARYDIRVNMALINAASALFDAKEFDNALPLFRMILPRGELIAHQSVRLRQLQIEAGIIAPEVSDPQDQKLSSKDSLFGKSYGVEEETFVERGNNEVDKPIELIQLEQLIETIKTMPPYEDEALYRNAYLYDEVKRPWEAVRFFDRVYQDAPDSELGKRSFYEVIRLLLNPLKEVAEAEPRALDYLSSQKEGLVPRQITYLLSGFYQQHRSPQKVKTLLPVIESFVPDDSPIARKYECELYYMQAVADLMMMEYTKAEASFRYVMETFPGSHQQENASYWHAATLLYLQQFEEALAEFQAYLEQYPDGDWCASAFFQSGTCYFGLENLEQAKALFTQVIERYADSPVCPDAYNLRGDILGSEGLLDEAISDYATAFVKASSGTQAKYSTFQMARVYEAESRYDEILRVVGNYLDAYGDEADIAEGIFWIGKTKVNQGRIDEAVQSYFDAIIEYGSDLEATGVDSMIDGLVHLSKTRLNDSQREALKADFIRAQQSTDSQTLRLRLRATVAQIEDSEVALGKALIEELPDFEQAAPPVLSAISDASFELKDYSRAAEILDVFLKKFEDSEFMRPAYKLRGYDLFKKGEYDAALGLIADAQARYGTDYDVAWAQILKGRCLAALGRHDEAVAELTSVMNVPGWRGESYAEAVYRLGQTEEEAGNLLKAHGWYQRAYFQYKGYAGGTWAADGYLGSARCLSQLGYANEARNTYRGMLFNEYVNHLPQCQVAKDALGPDQAREIGEMISSGVVTNFTITLDVEEGK
jgi:tetratricopeptide (TPR) repeat protein